MSEIGRERSPPVAADRDQRQPLGGGGVAGREDVTGGEIEERFDDRVGERGEPFGGSARRGRPARGDGG